MPPNKRLELTELPTANPGRQERSESFCHFLLEPRVESDVPSLQSRTIQPPQLSRDPLGGATYMTQICAIFISASLSLDTIQGPDTAVRQYSGPFEYVVAATYSGLCESSIVLDSCVVSLNTSSDTVFVRGVLYDRDTQQRFPRVSVALGTNSLIDRPGPSAFVAADTAQSDSLGRFLIRSRISNTEHFVLTYSFLGYFRYYVKLEKVIAALRSR